MIGHCCLWTITHDDMCTSVNVRSCKTPNTNTKKIKHKEKKKIFPAYLKATWYELYCVYTCTCQDIMTCIVIYSPKLNNMYEFESIHNISLCMYLISPDFCAYIHIEPSYLPTYLPTYLPMYRALPLRTLEPL